MFDFEKSTKTHCGVKNFAPSISSAIGTFLPQKYVYQVVISVLMVPRFLCLLAYKSFYELRIHKIAGKISWMVELLFMFHSLELISLLGLTIVPSKENFDVHKGFFVTFALSGLTYFVLTCFLWKYCGIYQEFKAEKKSFNEKMFWLKLYFVLGIAMSILYYWHNKYCPDYVYSFFCICEYLIVYANIKFHGTAKYDLANINIVLPSKKND